MKIASKAFSLLLALTMVLACLAGCTGSNIPAESESPAAKSQAAPGESVQPESALPAESVPAESEPPAEPAAPEANVTDITFPLEESVEVSFWAALPLSFAGLDTAYDIFFWQEIAERTNIEFDLISAAVDSASEQFGLMVAGGDMPDLIQGAANYYNGGATAAVEDGVLLDCALYLEDYLPNLYNFLYDGQHEELLRNILTDKGALPSLDAYHINLYPAERGMVIRQDWLDKVGMDAPVTIDELHDVLSAFKSDCGATGALWVDKTGIYSPLTGALGIVATYNSAAGAGYPFYVDHDVVKYGHLEDGFKEYLEVFSTWYNEGLIYQDFPYATSENFDKELLFNSVSGVTLFEVSFIETYEDGLKSVAGADAALTPLSSLKTSIDSDVFIEQEAQYLNGGWAVGADSESLDVVLTLCNYLYSDEGSILCNWGVEDYTFRYNDDGNPEFTDLILKDSRGLRMAMMSYLIMGGPYLYDNNKWIDSFTDRQKETAEIWTVSDQKSGIKAIPGGVSLTSEETATVAAIMGDIITYSSELIMSIQIGERPLSDFNEFAGELESMGIQDAIDIYQAAYDRYLTKA